MLRTISGFSGVIILLFMGGILLSSSILHEADATQDLNLTQSEKNAAQIWKLLGQKNYSEEARAGILGNIDQETGGTFEADIDETEGVGYGLIQWTPRSVLLNHINQAGITGNYKELATQVEVIDWELSDSGRGYIPTQRYPYSGEEFKRLGDSRLAARVYEKNRERPRDDHPERQALAQKWFNLFSGTNFNENGSGSSSIVDVALKELGNKGGEKFWSWYGYNYRVEWCAVFVSWCGKQINSDFERFAYCPTGVNMFKASNKWLTAGEKPKPGNIIFFDWESDGISDHVGLVNKYADGVVYTVEGNSNDEVKEQRYVVNSAVIVGYGIIE